MSGETALALVHSKRRSRLAPVTVSLPTQSSVIRITSSCCDLNHLGLREVHHISMRDETEEQFDDPVCQGVALSSPRGA